MVGNAKRRGILIAPLKAPRFLGASIPSLCFFLLPEKQSRLRIKFRGADGKPTDEPSGIFEPTV
jgi:hypothetical protein